MICLPVTFLGGRPHCIVAIVLDFGERKGSCRDLERLSGIGENSGTSNGYRLKINMVSGCLLVAQCGINDADFILTCEVCVCYLVHGTLSPKVPR